MPSAKFVNKVVDMSSQIRYLALRERAHRPVRGESTAEIFEAILKRAPVAPVRLNPDLPPKFEDIVSRALFASGATRAPGTYVPNCSG
jgi:hypothetical protein